MRRAHLPLTDSGGKGQGLGKAMLVLRGAVGPVVKSAACTMTVKRACEGRANTIPVAMGERANRGGARPGNSARSGITTRGGANQRLTGRAW